MGFVFRGTFLSRKVPHLQRTSYEEVLFWFYGLRSIFLCITVCICLQILRNKSIGPFVPMDLDARKRVWKTDRKQRTDLFGGGNERTRFGVGRFLFLSTFSVPKPIFCGIPYNAPLNLAY